MIYPLLRRIFSAAVTAAWGLGLVLGGIDAIAAEAPAKPAAKAAKPKPAAKAPAKKPAAKAKKGKSGAVAKPADDSVPLPSKLPWSLRAQYSITYGPTKFIYSMENGEWMLERQGIGTLVNNVGFSVTRGDGAVFNNVESDRGGKSRIEDVTTDLGPTRRYWTEMPPRDGLLVRHVADAPTQRPILLIYAVLTNVGSKPIDIAKVSPAVFGPGGIVNLGPNTTPALRHTARRGQYPIYDSAAPRMAVFQDRDHGIVLSVGVYPSDAASGDVSLAKEGNAWKGRVETRYEPAFVLKPGQTLTTAPTWVSFYASNPLQDDTNLAWCLYTAMKAKGAAAVPDAWVAVPADQSPEAVLAAASAWSGSKVNHALASAPWSGKDSYDARGLASSLKSAKMTPGLTVDPLAIQGAPENLTVAAPDGKRWLNVSLPEAKTYAVVEMKKPTEWGYAFFVVAPTTAPDQALRAMGLSRAQADAAAFEIMASAAGDRPVLPSAATTLGGNVDEWLQAAAQSGRLKMYGVPSGPVRLDASKVSSADDALALAMSFYGGPIELMGAPGQLKSVFPRSGVGACPVDGGQPIPRVWEVRGFGRGKGDAIVSFPGAGAFVESDLDTDLAKPVKRMQVEGGKLVESKR